MTTVEQVRKELNKYRPTDMVMAYEGESNGLTIFDSQIREQIGFINIELPTAKDVQTIYAQYIAKPEDHSSDCTITQNPKSECSCGVQDRLNDPGTNREK